jgi:tetratricopeptide (TPR) repeat protein
MKRLIYAIVFFTWGTTIVSAEDYKKAFDNVQQIFEQRSADALDNLEKYLNDYPYTPFVDEIYTMQGVLYSEKGDYDNTINALKKVYVKELSRITEPMYYFHMGYAYMQLKEYKIKAKDLIYN